MAKNEVSGDCAKHFGIEFQLARDLLEGGKIAIECCWTTDVIADRFTKPRIKVLLQKLQAEIGLQTDYHSTSKIMKVEWCKKTANFCRKEENWENACKITGAFSRQGSYNKEVFQMCFMIAP